MNFIFIFIFGIVIGSFLNVCIYRIPREESIAYPASHCVSCSHKLYPKDLVPVISYMMLKGKCRYCNEKISVRYPIIECLNAILYLFIYYKFGPTIVTLKYCTLISILIVISAIDYKTQDIYSVTTSFGSVAASVFMIIQYILYGESCFDYILGGITGASVIGLIVFITKGMGEGDIEIAGVCGLFVGYKMILLSLFLAIVMGGISGIIILLLKIKGAKEKIAFGPFIAIGTVISILYYGEIIWWYLKLIV